MRKLKTATLHRAVPQEFRQTQDITGSHELDAVIAHNSNPDMARRLEMYCDRSDLAYGPLTGYSGYHGYSGDN